MIDHVVARSNGRQDIARDDVCRDPLLEEAR
jgi:hypothetical protein